MFYHNLNTLINKMNIRVSSPCGDKGAYMGPCGSTKQFLYPFQFSIRTDVILSPGNMSDSCLVPISCTTIWKNEETNIVQEDRKEQSGMSDSTVGR